MNDVFEILKGGSGSGNFGHGGRKGQRGGSTAKSGGGSFTVGKEGNLNFGSPQVSETKFGKTSEQFIDGKTKSGKSLSGSITERKSTWGTTEVDLEYEVRDSLGYKKGSSRTIEKFDNVSKASKRLVEVAKNN